MKYLLSLGTFLLLAVSGMAQSSLGIYAAAISPTREFQKHGYAAGAGFAVEYNMAPFIEKRNHGKLLEVRPGALFEYFSAGTVAPSQAPAIASYRPLNVQNKQVAFTGTAKLLFSTGNTFRPYMEGQLGMRNFYSVTRADNDLLTENVLRHDWTLHYGIGIGVMYQLPWERFSLDFRMSYSNGAAASWIPLKSVKQNSSVSYDVIRSASTDLISVKLGLVYRINRTLKLRS